MRLGVRCPDAVRVTVVSSARHRCPFKDEVDFGTVRIEWTTSRGETIELHTLAALIAANADTEVSHERWTADLASTISADADVEALVVTSQWTTAGIAVSVRAPIGEDDPPADTPWTEGGEPA